MACHWIFVFHVLFHKSWFYISSDLFHFIQFKWRFPRIYIFSDFLNRKATIQMLTMYSRHYDETTNQWQAISAHVFTKNKQPHSDYQFGLNLIKEELEKQNIPCRKLVKLTDNCCSQNKSRYVLGDMKKDDIDFVGIYKTPGKSLYLFDFCSPSLNIDAKKSCYFLKVMGNRWWMACMVNRFGR